MELHYVLPITFVLLGVLFYLHKFTQVFKFLRAVQKEKDPHW